VASRLSARRVTQQQLRLLTAAAGPLSKLLLVLAAFMVLTAIVGRLFADSWAGVVAMLLSAVITGGSAGLLHWLARRSPADDRGRRVGLLVVALAWVAMGTFGGLPFVLGANFPVHDAIFEATSGFTTTGATILGEIEQRLSQPLHLWRLLTHWLGGLGLVVLFVAIFPALGVGGKHMYHSEVPGPRSQGLVPRIRDTSKALWRIYLFITLAEILLLMVAGMDPFNAIAHSFSTMGTGGFSTLNTSIAGFENVGAEMIIVLFMVVAGMNFGLIFEATHKRSWRLLLKNTELRVYLAFYAAVVIVVALNIWPLKDSLVQAFRFASFQVAAIISTTGFGTDDFETYPALSRLMLILCYFIGGSAGSTAGGMKVIRIIILVKVLSVELSRVHRPKLVAPVIVDGRPFPANAVSEVFAFIAVYLLTFVAGAVLVAVLDPVDLTTALMASLACVANVGPGLGMVGSIDNYGFFSPASKLVLSALMLLGRLEFFTLLALLNPRFWKR
jgi:trk system potassium uptake protein TrkH